MTRTALMRWCRSQPGVTEEHPFGPEVTVFKVHGKMFASVRLGAAPGSTNLKCDPRLAEVLRAKHPAITPGYHMSKRHWNTVVLDGSVPAGQLREMIEHSYTLVADSLPKAVREALGR